MESEIEMMQAIIDSIPNAAPEDVRALSEHLESAFRDDEGKGDPARQEISERARLARNIPNADARTTTERFAVHTSLTDLMPPSSK